MCGANWRRSSRPGRPDFRRKLDRARRFAPGLRSPARRQLLAARRRPAAGGSWATTTAAVCGCSRLRNGARPWDRHAARKCERRLVVSRLGVTAHVAAAESCRRPPLRSAGRVPATHRHLRWSPAQDCLAAGGNRPALAAARRPGCRRARPGACEPWPRRRRSFAARMASAASSSSAETSTAALRSDGDSWVIGFIGIRPPRRSRNAGSSRRRRGFL